MLCHDHLRNWLKMMNSVYSQLLYSVEIFRTSLIDVENSSILLQEEFRLTVRWIPRDFKYSDSQLSGETQEFNQASQTEEKIWVIPLGKNIANEQNELIRIAKSAFSDTFQAWTHLKAIRVFVESVLRYGLPPEFVSAVIKVTPFGNWANLA